MSDAVLSALSVRAAYVVVTSTLFAAVGFATVALASAFGVVRFLQDAPSFAAVSRHVYYTRLSTTVGVPMIAAAYVCEHSAAASISVVAVGLLVFTQSWRLRSNLQETVADVTSGGAIVAILVLSVYTWNLSGVVGAALYVVAAVLFNPSRARYVYSLKNVDVFHYLLAVANIALPAGLIA